MEISQILGRIVVVIFSNYRHNHFVIHSNLTINILEFLIFKIINKITLFDSTCDNIQLEDIGIIEIVDK